MKKIWIKFKEEIWHILAAILFAFLVSLLVVKTCSAEYATKYLTISHIKALSPRISDYKAQDLVDHFNKVGGPDAHLLAAIAFQESSFRYPLISGNDIGLFQLNYYWQVVKKNKIGNYPIEQLNEDWKLNTELAMSHLNDCRPRHPKSSSFPDWVCFHSLSYKYQKIYFYRVNKHLKKMEKIK